MGSLEEFSLATRLFLKAYPWRRIDPVPWTPLKKPVAQSRLVLLSSAGFVLPGQAPFDHTIKGGDWSFREIPNDTDISKLVETHRSGSFDHTGLRQDPNLAFPLDRLRELEKGGRIGSLNPRHISFMGSIIAPGRLMRDTAPVLVKNLTADGAEIALLTPV